ncbi:MAG: anthranilate phosphoribosyltransferase, partial [Promethearchaeota archaeon]
RRALGIRTIFNILGPLTNPSLVKRQVLGVFDPDLVEPIAHVLNKLGAKSAVVVHSEPGIDEIVPYKKVFLGIVKNGYVELQVKTARDFNINEFELDELKGDGPEYNLKVFADIIKGVDKGIKRDIVVLNAAYGLLVAEKAENLEVAKHVINRIIDSGQVIEQVKKIIKCSGGDMAKFDKLMES